MLPTRLTREHRHRNGRGSITNRPCQRTKKRNRIQEVKFLQQARGRPRGETPRPRDITPHAVHGRAVEWS